MVGHLPCARFLYVGRVFTTDLSAALIGSESLLVKRENCAEEDPSCRIKKRDCYDGRDMATKTLTKENFNETIEQNGIVIVDFWADWCGPCKTFAPHFEAASEKHSDIVFGKIDTQDQQELAGSFGIRSIPTIMIFREQIMLFNQGGALPPAGLEKLLMEIKGLNMDEIRAKIAKEESQTEDKK